MSRWVVVAFGSVAAVVSISIGMTWHPSVADAASASVSTQDYFFSPASMNVNLGDTVTWTNPTGLQHTSTSDTGMWSSPVLNPGGSFSFTFTTPGVFQYYCAFHASLGMVGTITVVQAAATPTPITVPAPTPTPSGSIGGRGFSLGVGSADLSWIGGTSQTGYDIGRLSLSNGVTILPTSGGPLSAAAVSFNDTSALPDPAYCYAVLPLSPSGLLGQSDLLCLLTNTAAGTSLASQFSIQLNQSNTATLHWITPTGATQLVLVALPLNGSPMREVALPTSQTTATDNTLGVPTCYALFSINASGPSGNTQILCGVPGFSTLGN